MNWRAIRHLFEAIGLALVLFVGVVATYNYFVHYQSRLDAWPPRSDFAPPVPWAPDNPDKIRILAIDGGAMHGLVSLEILKHLEQASGRPIAEMFDFVAGTSTGAIIGAMLLLPDENGKPKYTVDDVIRLYSELSRGIFETPLYHRIFTLRGVLGPRFLNHGKFVESKEVFKGYRFGELLRPMMIPTYSRGTSDLHLFVNMREPDANLSLGALLAAATSVPGMFPGVHLTGHTDFEGIYNDAALILNNPAHRAFELALERDPRVEFIVVSIGSNMSIDVSADVETSGGIVDWLGPMFIMASTGQARVSTNSLETLDDLNSIVDLKAYRLDVPLHRHGGVFDTSKANIDKLRKTGRDYVASEPPDLVQALEALAPAGAEQSSGLQ